MGVVESRSSFFKTKKKSTTAQLATAISQHEAKPQAPKYLSPRITAKKLSDFKVDVECKLRNTVEQAAYHPKTVDFQLGGGDDTTPLAGVLIKYQCGRKDNRCIFEEDIMVVYLVDEVMKTWCEGADMDKPEVPDMAGEESDY
jgi:hypothetical protein